MKKTIAILFLAFGIACNLFADVDVYKSADTKTASIIAKANQLIERGKYETAFSLLSEAVENEFIICKKVEMCMEFFVQSIMHKMFAFKDLEENETIDGLRIGDGNFDMYLFDPETVIEDYEAEHGVIPLLEKALGDYYSDVFYRYGNGWLIPGNELVSLAIEHYKTAEDMMELDANSYNRLGEAYYNAGEKENAIASFWKALELDSQRPDVHYNLAIVYSETGEYGVALEEAEKAAKNHTNPGKKVASLIFAAELANVLDDTDKAIAYLEDAKKLDGQNQNVFRILLLAYLKKGDDKNAAENADALFALAPEKPSTGQMVFDPYLQFEKTGELKKFFERNLKKYKKQDAAQATLYFYYLNLSIILKDSTNTKKYANMAKTCFEKIGAYNGSMKEMLAPYL